MTGLENELDSLLNELCRDWGFCLPGDERRRIATRDRLEDREFAIEVLRAEGFNPDYETEWIGRLTARFKEHFGKSVVSTDDFPGNP
jgi:hypothetical protein